MNDKKITTGIFWYWNADPTPAGIRKQLKSMQEAGFDSVYLHPMPDSFHKYNFFKGMNVSYLGKKYFELAAVMLEECKRLGLFMMLYDEGGWPSGGVLDGLVKKYPQDRACFLEKTEKGGLRKVFLDFPDLLSQEVTEHFIKMTYEPYYSHFANEFGKTIRGIFTDEPFWNTAPGRPIVRYNPRMETLFKEKYNCDFMQDILPYLWQGTRELPGAPEARRKYMEVCSELFATGYSEVLGRWCQEHHIDFEGHLDGEDDFFKTGNNGNFIRRLDGFQVPGVDTIWRQIYPGKAHGFFARFATAAAIRNKRPEALCESFNVYTYFITPEVMHYVGNDLLVKGINRILPMPYLYSDRKERKISCSTDFSPRNPIWKSLRALNDFWRWAGRFDTAALTPDVWLLARTEHPCPEDPQNIQGYPACHAEADQKVRELCIQLDRLGIFYRFADEKDLAGKERPKLLILPFETAVNDAASFPEIICGVPEDPAPYARVRILRGNGCFIHPVMRPEGEALMVFNPGKEMVDFVFESEKNYAELLPPDKTPSLLYPLRQEGKTITVPLCPGNLRILLVNGKQECLPKPGEPEKRLIDWQISRIERLMMSACGPTYFKKEKGGTPLPSSGKYTDIEPDFSGLLHLTGSLVSRGGKVLIELHNVQHSAALSVNGRPCGLRAFAPWVFEAELDEGENRLELEIASSGGNEFFRCFKEELEPRNWKNSYARRFTLYERDDRECGVDKMITLYPLSTQ